MNQTERDLDRAIAKLRRALATTPRRARQPGAEADSQPTAARTDGREWLAAQGATAVQPNSGARACTVNGCTRPVVARGWCNAHYRTQRRKVDPEFNAAERQRRREIERRMRARRRAEAAAYRAMRDKGVLP